MPITLTVSVLDTSNSATINGAKVFVDGINFADGSTTPLVTNAGGIVSFLLTKVGTRTIQITATNYRSTTASVTVSTTVINQSLNVGLTPAPAPQTLINLQFSPPQGGIQWSLNSGGSPVETGVSDGNGFASGTILHTYGSYTVTVTGTGLVGTSPNPYPITIDGRADAYGVTVVQQPNGANNQQLTTSSSVVSPLTAAINTTPANTVAADPNEFIYPSTSYDKYFTSTSVRIYIGNLFIDEVNTLQFALQDNAIPIFGYASRFADAYGQGRSLVQGQLILNFVTEGYLYTVMQAYQQFQSSGIATGTPSDQTVASTLGLLQSRDSLLQLSSNNPNIATPTVTGGRTGTAVNTSSQPEALTTASIQNITASVNTLNTQIQTNISGMTPVQLQMLSAARSRQLAGSQDIIGYTNAVYQDVIFDIRIEMGNETTGVKRVRQIEKCKLISNEQVYDQSGTPILDSYGFIGRRLR